MLRPLLILLALPASAQDNPIVARVQVLAQAYTAGDVATIAAIYSENAALFPPQMETLVGRPAIANLYARAFQGGATNLRFTVQEIRQHGPGTAVEIGETLIEVNGTDIRARYVHVWRLENGRWMLSRDIYNVIGPLQ